MKKCIDKFGITLNQLKSITTDNAGNVIGIVDYLDEETLYAIEEEELSVETPETTDGIPDDSIDDTLSEEEIRLIAQQIMEEEALESYLDDSDEYDDLLKRVVDDLPHRFNEHTVCVRCGAHTLHLTVRGALKKSDMKEIVTVCRKVAKLLRKEKYVRLSRQCCLQYSLPHLNVKTRWDSDYTMVIIFVDSFVYKRMAIRLICVL